MVMTFVLHPLSHYNSIIEPRARFLLSLIEELTIDFPFRFILSLIAYKDTATRDKLIFPSAITRIIFHFSVFYPESPYFTVMCAINVVIVRQSEAQLRPKQPWTKTMTPPAPSTPSTTTPSSWNSGVTLATIMVQLKCMDACLDTLSDELCQVNNHVSCIARCQARMGGFMASLSPSPSLEAFEDKDDNDRSGSDDDDDADADEDASSSDDEEMTTS